MKIVRYSSGNVPKPTKEDWDRLDSVKNEDIDYSDIPLINDFSKFHPWEQRQMFKPVKVAITCKLDADIVAWLKQDGKGYQTRLNAILREAMGHALTITCPSFPPNKPRLLHNMLHPAPNIKALEYSPFSFRKSGKPL